MHCPSNASYQSSHNPWRNGQPALIHFFRTLMRLDELLLVKRKEADSYPLDSPKASTPITTITYTRLLFGEVFSQWKFSVVLDSNFARTFYAI